MADKGLNQLLISNLRDWHLPVGWMNESFIIKKGAWLLKFQKTEKGREQQIFFMIIQQNILLHVSLIFFVCVFSFNFSPYKILWEYLCVRTFSLNTVTRALPHLIFLKPIEDKECSNMTLGDTNKFYILMHISNLNSGVIPREFHLRLSHYKPAFRSSALLESPLVFPPLPLRSAA